MNSRTAGFAAVAVGTASALVIAATNTIDQAQRRNECPTANPTVVTVAAKLEAKHFTETLDVDKLVACTGDTVQWVFTNETGGAVEVEFNDYKQGGEKTNKPVRFRDRPGLFTGDDEEKKMDDREVASYRALVTLRPSAPVTIKYSIRLEGSGKEKNHDPDLEIRPRR